VAAEAPWPLRRRGRRSSVALSRRAGIGWEFGGFGGEGFAEGDELALGFGGFAGSSEVVDFAQPGLRVGVLWAGGRRSGS
jgi:hypothetical protein